MIALILGGAYVAVLATKAALALQYVARERGHAPPACAALPEATIVQPVLSGDPQLETTLERNVVLLDTARFVWAIDEDDAAGRAAAAAIVARHPGRDIALLLAPQPPHEQNPKLFKLARACRALATEAFVVLDDDTVMTREGYRALLAALDRYAIATGLPSYLPGANAASSLVAHFVNDNAACTYLAMCRIAEPLTINGMCYAMRTATLAAIGGFAPLVHALADDLALARAVRAHGGRIYQSPWPHATATTVRDAGHYASLMHRWFLFASLLVATEPVPRRLLVAGLYVLPALVLWALLARLAARRTRETAIVACAVLAARTAILCAVQRQTLGEIRHAPLPSLVSELAQPLHALRALVHRTIRWRSRRYRVRRLDDFTELE